MLQYKKEIFISLLFGSIVTAMVGIIGTNRYYSYYRDTLDTQGGTLALRAGNGWVKVQVAVRPCYQLENISNLGNIEKWTNMLMRIHSCQVCNI